MKTKHDRPERAESSQPDWRDSLTATANAALAAGEAATIIVRPDARGASGEELLAMLWAELEALPDDQRAARLVDLEDQVRAAIRALPEALRDAVQSRGNADMRQGFAALSADGRDGFVGDIMQLFGELGLDGPPVDAERLQWHAERTRLEAEIAALCAQLAARDGE